MSRIDELLQQRAAIDAELYSLRDEAEAELERMKRKIQEIYGALNQPMPTREAIAMNITGRKLEPIDETDAGMGVREAREDATDAQSFTDELAELRARSQARRRR